MFPSGEELDRIERNARPGDFRVSAEMGTKLVAAARELLRRDALGEVTAGDKERARAVVEDFYGTPSVPDELELIHSFAAALASERAKQKEADARECDEEADEWNSEASLAPGVAAAKACGARIRARKP